MAGSEAARLACWKCKKTMANSAAGCGFYNIVRRYPVLVKKCRQSTGRVRDGPVHYLDSHGVGPLTLDSSVFS
jgi:hypothetical protein